jgi:predicted Zn-dependent protease with MMP-like domain
VSRIRLTKSRFFSAVRRAVRELPAEFQRRLDNVVIDVVDQPSQRELLQFSDGVEGLFGLIETPPFPVIDDLVRPPSRIRLFRRNLEAASGSLEDLICQIQETVIHEVGHYFGMSEEDLEPFEQAVEERRRRRLGEPPA